MKELSRVREGSIIEKENNGTPVIENCFTMCCLNKTDQRYNCRTGGMSKSISQDFGSLEVSI